MHTKGVGYSVKGQRSEENEDSFALIASQDLYLVADGVGGGPNGRDASKIVVGEFLSRCLSGVNRQGIVGALESANAKIKRISHDLGVKGMASTVSVAWFSDTAMTIFHAGDSRVYRVAGDGEIALSTLRHSKKLDDERTSKNIIVNAIGIRDRLQIDIANFDYQADDSFVLLSDGISDVVDEAKISEIVVSTQIGLFEKCTALASYAELKGGKDDKTVIIIAPIAKQ